MRALRLLAAWLALAIWLTLPASPAHAEPIGPLVTGGPSANQATELTSGVYQARVEQGRDAYFVVPRQWPGSRIWYGLNLISEPGTDPTVGFEASTNNGETRCDGDWVAIASGDLPIFSTASGFEVNLGCPTGDLTLRATASSVADGTPYQIVVWEEPPATNAGDYPVADDETTWDPTMPTGEPKQVTGGADWQSATVLADGMYTTEVGNGQVGLFRTHLDFGQYIQIEARMPAPPAEYVPVDGVQFFNPFGGRIERVIADDRPSEWFTSATGGPEGFASPTVTWRPSEETRPSAPALAGDYYFSFDITSPDLPDVSTVEFSFKVVDDPDGNPEPPVYEVTPSKQPSLQVPPPAREANSSNRVSYWLFGTAGCFAVAGTVLLGRARKIRTAMGG